MIINTKTFGCPSRRSLWSVWQNFQATMGFPCTGNRKTMDQNVLDDFSWNVPIIAPVRNKNNKNNNRNTEKNSHCLGISIQYLKILTSDMFCFHWNLNLTDGFTNSYCLRKKKTLIIVSITLNLRWQYIYLLGFFQNFLFLDLMMFASDFQQEVNDQPFYSTTFRFLRNRNGSGRLLFPVRTLVNRLQ